MTATDADVAGVAAADNAGTAGTAAANASGSSSCRSPTRLPVLSLHITISGGSMII